MRNGVVLIPTLDPDGRLVPYVESLTKEGFPVIIVDDGSHADRKPVFDELRAMDGVDGASVKVLVHAINYGKGRGLKNGQNYYLAEHETLYKGYKGIVTADSDGQHLAKDVIRLDEELGKKTGKSMIIGCRNFKEAHVPFKSRYGNQLTRVLFRFLFGKDISDTQTGLRAFTNEALYDLLDINGERYEYETNVLICAVHNGFQMDEMEIATVYENNNEGSHFHPVRDSIRIYKVLFGQFFRYMFVALSSFLLEILLFWWISKHLTIGEGATEAIRKVITVSGATVTIFACNTIARILSSIYNYSMNKVLVFSEANRSGKRMFVEYVLLCIASLILSSIGISLLVKYLGWNSTFSKCLVDLIIFVINYRVQKLFIFKKKN